MAAGMAIQGALSLAEEMQGPKKIFNDYYQDYVKLLNALASEYPQNQELQKQLIELATKSNTNKPAKFTYTRLIIQDHINRGLRHIANLGLRRLALVYRFLHPHIVVEVVKNKVNFGFAI